MFRVKNYETLSKLIC